MEDVSLPRYPKRAPRGLGYCEHTPNPSTHSITRQLSSVCVCVSPPPIALKCASEAEKCKSGHCPGEPLQNLQERQVYQYNHNLHRLIFLLVLTAAVHSSAIDRLSGSQHTLTMLCLLFVCLFVFLDVVCVFVFLSMLCVVCVRMQLRPYKGCSPKA